MSQQTCLVTVRHQKGQWDLELPADIPSRRVIDLLVEALKLPKGPLQLTLEPFGAVVGLDETLAAAKVYDGSMLLLAEVAAAANRPVTDSLGDTPAVGWRSLQPEGGGSAPTPVEQKKPVEEEKPGFSWKKLDL